VVVITRILVVDDSAHFRRVLSQLLASRGFELLEVVADGEAALGAVLRECPDGVLLDINLTGRDGFAVAALLAVICPNTRIVLTSSDLDGVPSSVLSACGATAFISKVELAAADLERLFVV
jgi:two-component system, chemotaxis family, protein-glutamate methylesterase/glutaminase